MSLVFDLLLFLHLRDLKRQDTVVHLGVDIVLGQLITDIKRTAHRPCVMFAADVLTFLVLLIVANLLGCGDGHVTVIQFHGDIILLESRKINGDLVALLGFLYVGLHRMCRPAAIKILINIAHVRHHRHVEIIIKQVSEQIVIKDTRYHHKSFSSLKSGPPRRTRAWTCGAKRLPLHVHGIPPEATGSPCFSANLSSSDQTYV